MKENLQFLIQSLQDEKKRLKEERITLTNQSNVLNQSRKMMARECLAELIPDLEMSTIETLQYQVPDFQVPTVSRWFGLGKKVAPDVSLNSLRIKLGAYLDNTKGEVPEKWRNEVLSIDNTIRDLQENLLRSNAERTADIGMRIAALEKLFHVDITKMDPKVRTRLEEALASQAKTARSSSRPYRSFKSAVLVSPSSSSRNQLNSSSDPSFLEMWLWWQILTPQSDYLHEIHRIESGGGDFAGAGASGTWNERSDTANTTPSSPSLMTDLASLAIQSNSISQTEEVKLSAQAELGSQNFS